MPAVFAEASALLQQAIDDRAFPAAAIEVGRRRGALWQSPLGRLTYDPDSSLVCADTLFDLASLTKVIATATLVMRAADEGRLGLDDRVARWIPEWTGNDRSAVTIADLLSHAAGLTAYLPFFRDHSGRGEFQGTICSLPLEYAPRSASIYSDLGFMLLGFILEDANGPAAGWAGAPGAANPARRIDAQFGRVVGLFTAEPLTFNPPRRWRDRTAPTERDPWRGRLLVGEVHDENTWALGGAAGHSGLFGSVGAVGSFARAVLATLGGQRVLAGTGTLRRFIEPSGVPGSSRALGWDTMLPTSSCGTKLSASSIGHTGFTGTSLWIDWERDLYVVLLTNRVHPSRDNERIRRVRPMVHDAVVQEFDGSFR